MSIPVWSVQFLIGLCLGLAGMRVWLAFCAYCETRPIPSIIPWRTRDCDGCIHSSAAFTYELVRTALLAQADPTDTTFEAMVDRILGDCRAQWPPAKGAE